MAAGGSPGRNEPCPCGSGKRYKQCCGRVGHAPSLRDQALEAHRAGRLNEAEARYREVLRSVSEDLDARHMLGVVLMQRLRYRDALAELYAVAQESAWAVPEIRHNLGLCLGHLLGAEAQERLPHLLAEFSAWESRPGGALPFREPLVSIVLPSYNHARFVEAALESIEAQRYRNFELIVIDDGSSDDSPRIIESKLKSTNYAYRFFARDNRGAPATLNEGAALARGDFLAFLNSDDAYSPDRLERLVAEIAATGKEWGFSEVDFIGEEGQHDRRARDLAGVYQGHLQRLLGNFPNSISLLASNLAISTGNLFVRRRLFEALGGFQDFRYNHDWDFCLRASAIAEPVIVRRALYRYRVHGANTIAESKLATKAEADIILSSALKTIGHAKNGEANPLSAWAPENQAIWQKVTLENGQGELFPPEALDRLARKWLPGTAGP